MPTQFLLVWSIVRICKKNYNKKKITTRTHKSVAARLVDSENLSKTIFLQKY